MLVPSGPWQERSRGLLAIGGLAGTLAWIGLGSVSAVIPTILGVGVAAVAGPIVGGIVVVLGLHAVGIQATTASVLVTSITLVPILLSLSGDSQSRSVALATTVGYVFLGMVVISTQLADLTMLSQVLLIVMVGAGCSYLVHRVELVQLGLTDSTDGETYE